MRENDDNLVHHASMHNPLMDEGSEYRDARAGWLAALNPRRGFGSLHFNVNNVAVSRPWARTAVDPDSAISGHPACR